MNDAIEDEARIRAYEETQYSALRERENTEIRTIQRSEWIPDADGYETRTGIGTLDGKYYAGIERSYHGGESDMAWSGPFDTRGAAEGQVGELLVSSWRESVDEPSTRWTLQEFSANPVGEPMLALKEHNESGEVLRGFTGTREELGQIIAERQIKPEELEPISEAEYYRRELERIEPSDTERVAEIASELQEYASLQAPLPYVNAEAAIAESFRQQLTSGSKTINLSQRYATDDQAAAQARHEIALQNLQPLMEQTAQLAGYKVDRGAAIAEGLKQREVPAIVQQQRYSMSL